MKRCQICNCNYRVEPTRYPDGDYCPVCEGIIHETYTEMEDWLLPYCVFGFKDGVGCEVVRSRFRVFADSTLCKYCTEENV